MSRLHVVWSLLAFAFLTGCAALPATSSTPNSSPSSHANQTAVKTQTSPRQYKSTSTVNGKGQSGSAPSQASHQPASVSSSQVSAAKPAKPTYPLLSLGSQSQAVLKLQQELSQLRYLPLTYSTGASGQVNWAWTYPNTPSSLRQLFVPGSYTVLVEGAVMSFERVHGMATDGIAGPQVWQAITNDLSQHRLNPHGYSYVYVSKTLPERLTLWHNGADVLVSPANTGIPQSPTPNGTWPVYLRYQSQTMSGTNPNGTHYSDPGIPYVNYFYQGDAVHGFIRASYGFPQSLGCVELPFPAAQRAWNYIHYGTLVTVSN